MILDITEEIKGFESNDPIIEILDNSGNRFYYLENLNYERVTFNLPTGLYYTDCDLTALKKPLKYVTPKLPIREKHIRVHKNIKTYDKENPNKASINVSKGFIIIDPEYISGNIPREVFIKFHEHGHYYYKTEWKCDVFSASEMLKRGYNPSQCYYSSAFCLSDNQNERKDILLNFLEKTICHE